MAGGGWGGGDLALAPDRAGVGVVLWGEEEEGGGVGGEGGGGCFRSKGKLSIPRYPTVHSINSFGRPSSDFVISLVLKGRGEATEAAIPLLSSK